MRESWTRASKAIPRWEGNRGFWDELGDRRARGSIIPLLSVCHEEHHHQEEAASLIAKPSVGSEAQGTSPVYEEPFVAFLTPVGQSDEQLATFGPLTAALPAITQAALVCAATICISSVPGWFVKTK